MALYAALALVVLTALTAVPGYAASTAPANAAPANAVPLKLASADPGTSVLTLTSLSPAVIRPGDALTVTGTVTARTSALTAPLVRLVVSGTPIVSRPDVTAWATSTAFLAGTEVGRTQLGAPVAVGQSVPFTVSVPAGTLSLTRAWGSIPLALQVRDTASNTSEVLRTFVGWQRRVEYVPISVAVVVPVTLSPNAALYDTDAAKRTAAWRSELAPGGRVQNLLDGTDADGPTGPVPVTWAVDPAVLGTSRGATSLAADDPLVPVVSPVVTRLSTGVARHSIWALPYADTDLAATIRSSPNDPTVHAQVAASTALGSALGVPVTTGVAWPTDGSLAAGREDGLRAAYQGVGLDSDVVSSSALPVSNGYAGQAPRRSPGGLPLLAWDDELSRLAARTANPADGALATQELVAETGTILGESPGVARSFLLALPRGVDPDPASLRGMLTTLAATPWVRVVGTDQLRQTAATQTPVANASAGTWTSAGEPRVDAAKLARIDTERHTANEIATILGTGGAALGEQWTAMLDQLTSTRWRTGPAQLAALETQVTQATAAATSGIHVADQTINFLADEGTLQVTVVNDLPVAVDGVRLLLGPTNPRLVIVAQPEPLTIGPGSRAVVQVRARAVSAGLVPVNTSLTTRDGTVIGTSSAILVRANPPGTGFYVIAGIVVGLVLLLGIVRTLRGPRRAPPAIRPLSQMGSEGAPSAAAPPPVSSDRPVR
ncbi:DUF6049 family protein [Lapillicoccus sp.]|uniref:DUF6049 family protein n=1 Tax=Lapillicoccus sp. TaxID=1909287 RepID=UPI003265FF40